MVKDGKKVGTFRIILPRRARGQTPVSLTPSVVSGTPVVGQTFDPPLLSGRLRSVFTAGSEVGRYYVVIKMKGGNETVMVVDAVEGI